MCKPKTYIVEHYTSNEPFAPKLRRWIAPTQDEAKADYEAITEGRAELIIDGVAFLTKGRA